MSKVTPAPSYRLYTRWNVELATLLGSPIAGALLLRKDTVTST